MPSPVETILALYRSMVRIRAFEDAAEALSQGGVSAYGKQSDGGAKVRGPLHLSTGQEAVAAGVCAHLSPLDYLTSTHRGHGHTLAKGASPAAMMAELFGKASGCNQGKGGSMHIADFAVGMLGANGVVAAGMSIAVGAAHAQKLTAHPGLTVCFFGDGAINRGPFVETLNWARAFALPVLFVCEDNRWSATTPSATMTAGPGAAARAAALGLAVDTVDGNDVLAVHAAAGRLVQRIRSGEGPQFLHALTYRVKGHVSVDAAAYRSPDEVAEARQRDPIALAGAAYCRLSGAADAPQRLQAIAAAARDEVAAAVAAAEQAPWPDAALAFSDVQSTGAGQWH